MNNKKVKEIIPFMELEKVNYFDFIVNSHNREILNKYKGKMMFNRHQDPFRIKNFQGVYKRKKIKTGLFSKPKWERVFVLTNIQLEIADPLHNELKLAHFSSSAFRFIIEEFNNWIANYTILKKKIEIFEQSNNKQTN